MAANGAMGSSLDFCLAGNFCIMESRGVFDLASFDAFKSISKSLEDVPLA